jgi:DNA polymerase-3 subunit epsilon
LCLADHRTLRPEEGVLRRSKDASVLAESIIVLDFETTGLRCDQGDRVTEIAALRVHGNRIVERFETLVNCGARIPAYIAKFTGITQSMVDTAPAAAGVFARLLEFIGPDAVIAHNAGFDQDFLDGECRRLGLVNHVPEFICSVQITRRMFPDLKSHALGCLASRLGIPFTPGAHRAAVDATVTANILFRASDILRTRFAVPSVDVSTLRRFACLPDEVAVASAA